MDSPEPEAVREAVRTLRDIGEETQRFVHLDALWVHKKTWTCYSEYYPMFKLDDFHIFLFCCLCRSVRHLRVSDSAGGACGVYVMWPTLGEAPGPVLSFPLCPAHALCGSLSDPRPVSQQPAKPLHSQQGHTHIHVYPCMPFKNKKTFIRWLLLVLPI